MTAKLCPTCAKELGTHQAWDLKSDRYYCSDFCLDKARAHAEFDRENPILGRDGLLKKIGLLEAENVRLREGYLADENGNEYVAVCILKEKIWELREALEFYAEDFTWARVGADSKAGCDRFFSYGEKARLALERK